MLIFRTLWEARMFILSNQAEGILTIISWDFSCLSRQVKVGERASTVLMIYKCLYSIINIGLIKLGDNLWKMNEYFDFVYFELGRWATAVSSILSSILNQTFDISKLWNLILWSCTFCAWLSSSCICEGLVSQLKSVLLWYGMDRKGRSFDLIIEQGLDIRTWDMLSW